MDTYNKENILNDFNRLIDLYSNSLTAEDRKKIYFQMCFISNIDPRLGKYVKISNYKTKNNAEILKEKEKSKKKKYLELDSLTRNLCFNLLYEINKYYPLNSSILTNRQCNYETYINLLEDFLSRVFPDDLELFRRDNREKNLIIKRGFLFSSANIFYLEDLKKYYINIEYCKNLKIFDIASTAHEYGHASTFMQNFKYNSKDFILDEAISSLYELLFFDYYLRIYGKEDNYLEMIRIFNTYCIRRLNKILGTLSIFNYSMTNINMMEALYGQLIAATIYIKYNNKDINKIIKILQSNYSSINGFELLKKIDIDEEDLLDTSMDISKLVLKK